MPEYNLNAVIVLNAITVSDTVRAVSFEAACEEFEARIGAGKFEQQINEAASSVDFDIEDIIEED